MSRTSSLRSIYCSSKTQIETRRYTWEPRMEISRYATTSLTWLNSAESTISWSTVGTPWASPRSSTSASAVIAPLVKKMSVLTIDSASLRSYYRSAQIRIKAERSPRWRRSTGWRTTATSGLSKCFWTTGQTLVLWAATITCPLTLLELCQIMNASTHFCNTTKKSMTFKTLKVTIHISMKWTVSWHSLRTSIWRPTLSERSQIMRMRTAT